MLRGLSALLILIGSAGAEALPNNTFSRPVSSRKYAQAVKKLHTQDQPSESRADIKTPPLCDPTLSHEECQVFSLVNQVRESKKLKPLKFFRNCQESAQSHSRYMSEMSNSGQGLQRSVNHDLFKERSQKFKVIGYHVTENVGGGKFANAEALLKTWLSSPKHRRNILETDIIFSGVSMQIDKQGHQFWTQCFSTN